jgi:hypothetical protein
MWLNIAFLRAMVPIRKNGLASQHSPSCNTPNTCLTIDWSFPWLSKWMISRRDQNGGGDFISKTEELLIWVATSILK